MSGEQSVEFQELGLPLMNEIRGRVYDEANKLDTSCRAQYSLLVLSRICRPISFLYVLVYVTGLKLGRKDDLPIGKKEWCKHLNTHKARIHKPWEPTAYTTNTLIMTCSMRSRSLRSSFNAKGDSSNKLYFSTAPKHKKDSVGPDSFSNERPKISVSS